MEIPVQPRGWDVAMGTAMGEKLKQQRRAAASPSAGPASPAFMQGSSWSPSRGDSRVPELPVASWWHVPGRAALGQGWAMQPGVQDGYARTAAGDLSPALSPKRVLQACLLGCPQSLLQPAPGPFFGDPQVSWSGCAFANQPGKRELEDVAHQSAPTSPSAAPSGGCRY